MAQRQNQDPGWIIPLLQVAGGAALLATLLPGVRSRFPSFGIIALAVLVAAVLVLAGFKVYRFLIVARKKSRELEGDKENEEGKG
jgi:hypothetical protein